MAAIKKYSKEFKLDAISLVTVQGYSKAEAVKGGSCSEVYLEKAFDGMDFKAKESLPVAKELGETSLMFLVHPTITSEQMDEIVLIARDV